MYSKRSTKSKKLKTYKKGTIVKYRAYNKNWFKVTVKVKTTPKSVKGVATKKPTRAYKRAAKQRSIRRTSFSYGTIINYETFTTNWHKVTVEINGKKRIGYIHKNDIGSMKTALSGYVQKNPTYVYEKRSKKSKKLRNYSIGTKITYRASTKNWYRVTVKVNGQNQTGYVHKKDIRIKVPVISGYTYKSPTYVYQKRSRKSKKYEAIVNRLK